MVKFILGRSGGVLFGPPLVGFRGVLRGIEGNRARNSNRPESLNSGLLIFLGVIGRGDWIRTSDPLRPRQVRYQAALRPDLNSPRILRDRELESVRLSQNCRMAVTVSNSPGSPSPWTHR